MKADAALDLAAGERPQQVFQTSGISCGPACIKMVLNSLGKHQNTSIEKIAKICGTNPQTGTDDKAMEFGLNWLSVPYRVGQTRHTDGLIDSLAKGNLVILRTLTRGTKHWIVLTSYSAGKFQVNDPWLGQIEYTPQEVKAIWQPRDYFYFEVPPPKLNFNKAKISIRQMAEADIPEVLPLMRESFRRHSVGTSVDAYVEMADLTYSIVAVYGDEIIGFYLLTPRDLPLEDLQGLRGIEGIALAVKPEFRGTGVGKKLADYPKSYGFDYLWGMQLKSLGNLNHWLKRRELVADGGACWFTMERYNKAAEKPEVTPTQLDFLKKMQPESNS
jgi:GNAT superfamily N-acetyltransferase